MRRMSNVGLIVLTAVGLAAGGALIQHNIDRMERTRIEKTVTRADPRLQTCRADLQRWEQMYPSIQLRAPTWKQR